MALRQHVARPIAGQHEHPGIYQQEIYKWQQQAGRNTFQRRQGGAEPNGAVDEEIEEAGVLLREVLAGKDLHRLVEDVHVVEAARLGALTLVMDDARLGKIVVLVAALENPVREVDIFPVHKVVLVEEAHLVEDAAAHHHKGAGEHLHRMDLIVAEIREVIGSELARAGEEFGESKQFVKGHRRQRDAALGLGQELALPVDHLDAETAGIGRLVHETNAFLKGILLHHGVGVEQEHIFTLCQADGLVIGTGKAHVLLVGDYMYLRKLRRQHL